MHAHEQVTAELVARTGGCVPATLCSIETLTMYIPGNNECCIAALVIVTTSHKTNNQLMLSIEGLNSDSQLQEMAVALGCNDWSWPSATCTGVSLCTRSVTSKYYTVQ